MLKNNDCQSRVDFPNSHYSLPCIRTEGKNLVFFDGRDSSTANPVWDALWNIEWPGQIAVACAPDEERVVEMKQNYSIDLDDEVYRTKNWTQEWLDWLRENLYFNAARMALPGDYCPALDVPGFIHGQSQGITDLFGVEVERLPDGNFYAHAFGPDPKVIAEIISLSIESSQYYHAVEYIQYAHGATDGAFPFHNPVMTSPLDTANYVLGTTPLMEWLYTEPEVVHHLLNQITEVIIEMVGRLRDAAGGLLCSHHLSCVRGGFDLCSEDRSLISFELYEKFEAPYLKRVGEALGTFSAHSCGNWERTVTSMINDPNFCAMNGQIKENDLATLCNLASGQLTLSIGRSMNVHDRFMWPDTESYYCHILETVPDGQPLELIIETESDIQVWDRLHREVRGKPYAWTGPQLQLAGKSVQFNS